MARKKKASDEQILYFDQENLIVYIDPGDKWYESFVPTRKWVDGERGWLVVVDVSTYDSNGPGSDRVEIVDAYPDEDLAHEVAKAIQVFGSGRSTPVRVLDIPLGNGVDRLTSKTVMYGKEYDRDMGWTSWGNSPRSVTVYEFVVNKKPKRDNVYEIGYI